MNKYLLSFIASVMLFSFACIQCNNPTTTHPETGNTMPMHKSDSSNAQTHLQSEGAMPMNQTESKTEPDVAPAEKGPVLKTADFSLKSVKASVEGTSTLHSWESQITKMQGKGTFLIQDNILAALKDVEIKIAVEGIKSKEGKKMDKKTYETFNSDKNPNIIYAFTNAVVKINASHVVTVETTGKLSMAGTSKSVSLTANGKELANGDLQLSISHKIKMTDYKMDPPVMFLGTIKVGDEITVHFDFVLTQSKAHK